MTDPSIDLEFQKYREAVDADYDGKAGVETSGRILTSALNIRSRSRIYGVAYQAVFPDRFFAALDTLKIAPASYTFIDFGAGKGRALFLAQEAGFKKIVGIEYASDLVAVCEENIQLRKTHRPALPIPSILHMDACSFTFPPEATLIYLYNPFGEAIMEMFARNLTASLASRPRPLCIIYINAVCDQELMANTPGLTRVSTTETFNTYRWIGHGG